MSPQQLPTASVVVPVRDGAADLERCLSALDAQDYPPERYEVLVADNASVDDVASVVARHPRARLVHQPEGGSYAARNAAIAVATGEVVAFTDADCSPLPDWLSAGVSALVGPPRADAVGGAVQLTYARGAPRTGGELFDSVFGFPQQRYVEEHGFGATANVVTWRATLDRVGLFDASLMSGGDKEWGRRLAAAGGVMRYAPDAVVRHPARAALGEALAKARRIGRGRLGTDYRGPGARRHWARTVRWELKGALDEVARSRAHPQMRSPLLRARYLGVNAAYRVVMAATLLGGGPRVLLPRGAAGARGPRTARARTTR